MREVPPRISIAAIDTEDQEAIEDDPENTSFFKAMKMTPSFIRFDCQFLMATFTNVYIHTFINIPTPGKVIVY